MDFNGTGVFLRLELITVLKSSMIIKIAERIYLIKSKISAPHL